MRVYSLLYESVSQIKQFVNTNNLISTKKYLIKIHTSKLVKDEIEDLVKSIRSIMPKSEIVGCSVGGIIFKGKSLEKETLISFIDCYDTDMKTTSIKLTDNKGYKSVDQIVDELLWNLQGIDDSFIFMFYPPAYPCPSQIIDEMNRRAKNFKIIGGGAYSPTGDLYVDPAFLIHEVNVTEDYIVAAKLKGHLLIANQATATGIESIGKTYQVTKSQGHHVIEINNMEAKKWVDHLIGTEFISQDPNIVDAFPLVRKDHEGYGLNIIYEADPFSNQKMENEIFVFDTLSPGDEIMVGYIDPTKAMMDVEKLCKEIGRAPTEALFAYSCLTRRNILQNCAKWELQPFTSTQITGAFMAGELVWNGSQSTYSNSAFTVAALSEDGKATVNLNVSLLKENNKIQFDNLRLVNYLFSTVHTELKENMKESKQSFANQLVFDQATGLPNLSKFIFDSQKNKINSLCLVSLKNENIIRVFLNKKNYSNYINAMIKGFHHFFDEDYQIYIYNELSILIAQNNHSREDFIQKMQDYRTYLNQLQYDNYIPIYELSIAFGETDLLKKVEICHLNLRKSTGDILVYAEKDNQTFNHELQILQVINDAISYGRVIPYYQGIYNNKTKRIELCESLMRITDQDGKIYLPNDFLGVAKEYKLYERLSKMMIEKVFEEAEKNPFVLTINLNVQDIYNYDILKLIFANLKKSSSPDKFIFEIVEGEEITDYDYLREFTNKIHALGGKIAIDDFGAGYSNLLHVLKIDVDYLKITGEIVKDICSDPSCQEFVSMISNWGNTRGKKIIAEYVENESIQDKLLSYDVSYSQGYLFSIPQQLEE